LKNPVSNLGNTENAKIPELPSGRSIEQNMKNNRATKPTNQPFKFKFAATPTNKLASGQNRSRDAFKNKIKSQIQPSNSLTQPKPKHNKLHSHNNLQSHKSITKAPELPKIFS
jgi:hypothetical protein